ncbi:radical SAM protein [Candidatus Bipolaricaulota bacterium]|nr:radical SAM protein [Candidatus Bipolaricaulota bacterium]
MIKEITAKTLISRVSGIDSIFGLDYGMNLYRGCQHRCIYCDSRSMCYGIEDFDGDVLVKTNALDLLRDELPRKRRKGIIGTGSMNDPYMPLEEQTTLTRRALEIIAAHGFGVHVVTKSDLVIRDIDVLQRIAHVSAAVSLTITAADDKLSQIIEPGAPPSSSRFRAMRRLSQAGIETRLALMPILPFIEDSWANVSAIIEEAHRCGAKVVIPWMGMSLRDRQRAYFYAQLDESFPGLRERYQAEYGQAYACASPHSKDLYHRAHELCARLGIATQVKPLLSPTVETLGLFDQGQQVELP